MKLLISMLALLVLVGCTDAKPHTIKQYSGGVLVGEWESTGIIKNEQNSDGWYFEDAKTHKLVELTGTVQITVK